MFLTDKQTLLLLSLLQSSLAKYGDDYFPYSYEDRERLLNEIINQQTGTISSVD